MIIRQGDILLERVNIKPQGKGKSALSHTLAFGEFTGHSHLLTSKVPSIMYGEINEPVRYLVVQGSATIDHQEHKQVQVPKGTYKVTIEKEYDYFTKTIQTQRD